jgi:hypothetical protein
LFVRSFVAFFNNNHLEQQIDHKQVFNGTGIQDKSSVVAVDIENVVNRVDFEPRSV